MRKSLRKLQGFTVVELMITLVVIAILAAVAAPSFVDLLRNNRLASQTNLFATALSLARSEAVKRNVNVVVCKRNGAACDNNANWEDGWIVFADIDNDVTVDANETIRLFEELDNGYTLRVGNTYTNWLRYMPKGDVRGSGGVNGDTFRLCASDALAVNDPNRSRSLNINFSGRVSLAEGTTACP